MDKNEYKYEMNIGQEITANSIGAARYHVYLRVCPTELPAGFWDEILRVFAIKRYTKDCYTITRVNTIANLGFSYYTKRYKYDDIMITKISFTLAEIDPAKAWLARWTITPR
jgi:hypothetical protein